MYQILISQLPNTGAVNLISTQQQSTILSAYQGWALNAFNRETFQAFKKIEFHLKD